MIHLQQISLRHGRTEPFPFTIPALQQLALSFTASVVFFVGENGSGKSTLLEALALEVGSPTVGNADARRDPTLQPVRDLADSLKLVWRKRTRQGFFMRAEDFFGYVQRLNQMRAELEADLSWVDEEYAGRSDYAKGLARMPYAGELHALKGQYGRSLDNYSHGESFLELFQSRLRPGGLYLLDEPEAPLSPLRQLSLLSLLRQAVRDECQFIIATHSPILMALPDAVILSFDERPLRPVPYDELEHVVLTRSFLQNPEQYLRHL